MNNRINRDPQIEAYLASLQGELPKEVELMRALSLHNHQRARQVYNDYRRRHESAPPFNPRGKTNRQRREAADERVAKARLAGMSIKEIAATGELGSKSAVADGLSRLRKEGKVPGFRATSPETKQRIRDAKRMQSEGLKQREIAEALGMSRPGVSRLLRHGGRRSEPKNKSKTN